MTQIHITGANGFPANTYIHLLENLEHHQIEYLNLLGHPYQEGFFTWDTMIDQVINNIESFANGPVIGFGHSLGAVTTYLASQKRPDLFSKLILVEPVLFKSFALAFIKLERLFDKHQRSGKLSKQASTRKELFTSKDEAHKYFSSKNLFKYFSPASLNAYIEHGLKKSDDGYTLTFDRRVESKIFSTVPIKFHKSKHTLPTHVIFGQQSNLSWILDIPFWQRNFSNEAVIFQPGGHLFPFDRPDIFSSLFKALVEDDKNHLDQHEKMYPRSAGFFKGK